MAGQARAGDFAWESGVEKVEAAKKIESFELFEAAEA